LVHDFYSLHQLLEETQDNYHDIRYVFVVDPDGEILAHTFSGGFPLELVDLNSVDTDAFQNTAVIETIEGLVWDVAVPIFDGKAGIARVGISDQNVRDTMITLTSQLLITMVGVLAVSLLAATFLTWILTRPILDLVEATKSVAQGDFSPRVRRWANDEIGDLGVAFNLMTEELGRLDEVRLDREQLRRKLLEGVILAQEEERRRIARELHDSTSQSLTSLKVNLTTLENACECLISAPQYENMCEVLDQTLDEVHNLAVQLRPAALDDLGLDAALERYLMEWQHQHLISVDYTIHTAERRLPEVVETAVYRIIQESLTNVVRHAEAQSVSILVERRGNDVITVIEDDGKGLDETQINSGTRLGLLGIRERTELLSGSFTIESSPNQGTSLFIRIPIGEKEKM
jgi:signal transduction histidine kinase